jgi:hypothetical protein
MVLVEPTAGGKKYAPPRTEKPRTQAFSAMPYGCDPDAPLPPDTGGSVVQVIIPGTFKRDDGKPFDGRLIIGLSWNAKKRQWLMISTSLLDVPSGNGVFVPPA